MDKNKHLGPEQLRMNSAVEIASMDEEGSYVSVNALTVEDSDGCILQAEELQALGIDKSIHVIQVDREPKNSMSGIDNTCVICGIQFGESAEKYSIFDRNPCHTKPIFLSLTSILGYEISENTAWAQNICKVCVDEMCEISKLELKKNKMKRKFTDKFLINICVNETEIKNTESGAQFFELMQQTQGPSENNVDIWDVSRIKGENEDDDEEEESECEYVEEEYMSSKGSEELDEIVVSDDDVWEEPLSKSRTRSKETTEEIDLSTPLVRIENKFYECLVCLEKFELVSTLQNHLRAAHKKRVFLCVCGEQFKMKNVYAEHMNKHILNNDIFMCNVCDKPFTDVYQMWEHFKTHSSKKFQCEYCSKLFRSRKLLQDHVNKHVNRRPYKCDICLKTFTSVYSFKSHEKLHVERPRPFACGECGKTFHSAQRVEQHKRIHLNRKDFVCEICGKLFSTKYSVVLHEKSVHLNIRPFSCSICDRSFTRQGDVTKHERCHTGQRPFQCDLCSAAFTQSYHVQRHKLDVHVKKKPFSCDTCGESYKRKTLLDYHVRRSHTGQRPFECRQCSASFMYSDHLKKHEIIHTGKKPYKCSVCGKGFSSRDNRTTHMYVHSKKKPYECVVCHQSFMRKGQLFKHMDEKGHAADLFLANRPDLTNLDNDLSAGEVLLNIEESNLDHQMILNGEARVIDCEELYLENGINSTVIVVGEKELNSLCAATAHDNGEIISQSDGQVVLKLPVADN